MRYKNNILYVGLHLCLFNVGESRRQGGGRVERVHAVHDDKATKPRLHAGDIGTHFDCRLYRHGARA